MIIAVIIPAAVSFGEDDETLGGDLSAHMSRCREGERSPECQGDSPGFHIVILRMDRRV